MVSVCLPSDALSQYVPSYLGFSYFGCGVSLHGSSSKAQPLLLTLDEGYLLTAAPPDLERGVAPLGPPPAPAQPPLLGHGVAPLSCHPRPRAWGCSSRPLPLASGVGWLPMAESEQELKSLLMKVKEESEKVGLKLTFRKRRSWHLVPLLHGN